MSTGGWWVEMHNGLGEFFDCFLYHYTFFFDGQTLINYILTKSRTFTQLLSSVPHSSTDRNVQHQLASSLRRGQ